MLANADRQAIQIVETATLIKNINSGLDSGKYW